MRSPQEIVTYVNKIATEKLKQPHGRIVILAILAGVYISMGALLSVAIGYGFPGIAETNPSIVRLLMASVFPIGLIIIALAGGELFTGCCAYFVPNMLSGRQKWQSVAKYCTIVWIANFAGALLFGYLLVYLPEISQNTLTQSGFLAVAKVKMSNPLHVTILKGVGANWLVCLAIWLGFSSKSVAGKMMGIWFPIMAFVALGYEHSVANMFLLPMAMFEGADISITDMLFNNILPVTLGNIIGGALFVGGAYWYIYDKGANQPS